jgi:hypothetical protein
VGQVHLKYSSMLRVNIKWQPLRQMTDESESNTCVSYYSKLNGSPYKVTSVTVRKELPIFILAHVNIVIPHDSLLTVCQTLIECDFWQKLKGIEHTVLCGKHYWYSFVGTVLFWSMFAS